jgi:hypothetical protein
MRLPTLMLLAAFGVLPLRDGPDAAPQPPADAGAEEKPDAFRPDPGWKPLGPSLWFDPKERRVLLRAKVVLREGPLEHLLCLRGTKEHEAILSTRAIPRQIHAGLLLTGAEPGHPVKWVPKFDPPTGTKIAIALEWEEDGKARRANAKEWVRDEQKKREMATDWVFAGSELVPDPVTKKPFYLADDGDLVTVSNFASAILDVPFASSANDADRPFVAYTERIPPRGTGVTLSLRPKVEPAANPKTP